MQRPRHHQRPRLRATDPEQADHQLTYTLTAVPSVGTIFRNGQSVGLSGSFTQQDIDNGALDYVQDRGSAAGDSFTVSVSDGHGGTTPGQVVTVSIISSMAVIDDGPLVVTSPNSGNHQYQIGSSILRTVSVVANSNNNGIGDNTLFYQIVTAPTVGTLLKNGTPLTSLSAPFTQNDVDQQSITYQIGPSASAADSFVFTVHDQNNQSVTVNTISNVTFHVSIRHQPTQTTNNQLTLGQGQSAVITSGIMVIQDSADGDSPGQLIYSLNNQPSHGVIMYQGAPLAANGTFTQLDINNGLVSYVNDGSANSFDNVNFQTGDIANPNQSGANLSIQIITDPVLVLNTGMSVNALSTNNFINGNQLEVSDGGLLASSLQFTLTAVPAGGTLRLSGGALGVGSHFTQQDILSNNLSYDDTTGNPASFTFTVSNGFGGTIPATQFDITINSAGKSNPSLSWVNITNANQTYGAGPFNSVGATTNSGDTVTIQVLSGPATFSSGTLTLTGAGQVVLQASDPGNNNLPTGWNPATTTLQITVNQLGVTLVADSLTRAYGAPNPTLTFHIPGLIGTDSVANSFTGSPQLSVNSNPSESVGSVDTININQGNLQSNNYFINGNTNGTLTVQPATLTVAVNNAARAYGAQNPPFSVTYSGFANGDDSGSLGGALNITTPAVPTTPAGTGGALSPYDITASSSTLSNSNYSIQYTDGFLTVTPALLTVEASNQNAAPNVAANLVAVLGTTYTVSGFANGDTSSILSGSPTLSCAASGTPTPGTYPITIAQNNLAANANYSFTLANGTLTVGHQLTVTVQNASKVYGGANPLFNVVCTGFQGVDSIGGLGGTLTFSTSATTASGVGSYSVSASGLANGGSNTTQDYNFVYVNGTLDVTPAPLTVKAHDASRPYGSANPTFTAFAPTPSQLLNGDTLASLGAIVFNCSASAGSSVNSYAITPEGLTAPNYSITYLNGSLSVTPVTLTVTAANNTMPGAGTVPTPVSTVTYSGFVNGDTAGSALTGLPSITTTAVNGSPVGTYPISVALGTLAANGGDYVFTFVGATMLDGTPMTISVAPSTCVYGSAAPSFTVLYNGSSTNPDPSNITGTAAFGTSYAAGSPTGGYTITPSGLSGGAIYAITYAPGTLTVTRKPLTVTASDETSAYGASIAALAATYGGFVNGDSFATTLSGAPALATTATSASAATTYPISCGLGSLLQTNLNYQLFFVNGTYTVSKAALTVTATSTSRAYGAANPAFTFTSATLFNGDTIGSVTEVSGASVGTGVGTPSITISAAVFCAGSAANYTITYVPGATG